MKNKKDEEMKIMVSSLTYPLPNGVTASLNTAVDGLLREGHKVMIVAPKYKVGKARPEHQEIPSSLVAHRIAMNLFGKEERVFRINSKKRIDALAKKFNPDIYWLHTVTWGANAFETQMLNSSKKKVLFYHTLVEEYGRLYAGEMGALVMRKRTKALCNKVDAVMTPSNMMKNKLLEYGVKKPIYIIPTGISAPKKSFTKKEIREKFNLPPNKKILLYLGRMSKEKNIEALLKMMVDLKRKNYKAILLFVGPGDIQEVKKKSRKMGIEDVVFCIGPLKREEAQKVYGGCDVFTFSSQTETQGLVVGEAMLVGLPVVALASPIQREVYPEGKAVILKKEENFSQAVIDILENKEKRERMTKEAKKFVLNNFSKSLMTERQIKVFKDVLKKDK